MVTPKPPSPETTAPPVADPMEALQEEQEQEDSYEDSRIIWVLGECIPVHGLL